MARVCKYGKLKNPKGRRVCRKSPKKGSAHAMAPLAGYRRRRRRSR